ncbi:YdeI family protein [Lysobacter koreensis]|uniref:YdeI family protein n=1 Tax=Lysobacter koreensis TaxID=266122 RepID=A0ABW2YK60_9GAMM
MTPRDPRIDAYIARQADFARPLLEYLRETVHEACPGVEETLKWSAPAFVHAGGILCSMAAFKQHASFGYWKHALVVGEDESAGQPREGQPREGMGSYGKLTTLKDLPPKKQLLAHLRRAMQLNEDGVKTPGVRKTTAPRPPPQAPADLAAALRHNAKAKATFEAFPPSQQREYVDWITEAKRDETRHKRLAQAVEWLAEGKQRHWKYQNC